MTKKQKEQIDLVGKVIRAKLNLYNKTCDKGFELTMEEVLRHLEHKLIKKIM